MAKEVTGKIVSKVTSAEEQMLGCAKALQEAMLKVDTNGVIACFTMTLVNYCREAKVNPIAVSQIIHEAIEDHIEEIKRGEV